MWKAPVKSSSSTYQHPIFTGWMPFLSPDQQCQSTEGKKHHTPQTWSHQAHLRDPPSIFLSTKCHIGVKKSIKCKCEMHFSPGWFGWSDTVINIGISTGGRSGIRCQHHYCSSWVNAGHCCCISVWSFSMMSKPLLQWPQRVKQFPFSHSIRRILCSHQNNRTHRWNSP